jgi:hypothetical protein
MDCFERHNSKWSGNQFHNCRAGGHEQRDSNSRSRRRCSVDEVCIMHRTGSLEEELKGQLSIYFQERKPRPSIIRSHARAVRRPSWQNLATARRVVSLCHSLRHTFVTRMMEATGNDVGLVMSYGGNRSIDPTVFVIRFARSSGVCADARVTPQDAPTQFQPTRARSIPASTVH